MAAKSRLKTGRCDVKLRAQLRRDLGGGHRPRVGHDELTRQRDAGALDAHEQRDARVAERRHHVDAEPAEEREDRFDHVKPRWATYPLTPRRSRKSPAGEGTPARYVPTFWLALLEPSGAPCTIGADASSILMSTAVMLSSPPRSLARSMSLGRHRGCRRAGDDVLDVVVAHHPAQAVGAEHVDVAQAADRRAAGRPRPGPACRARA